MNIYHPTIGILNTGSCHIHHCNKSCLPPGVKFYVKSFTWYKGMVIWVLGNSLQWLKYLEILVLGHSTFYHVLIEGVYVILIKLYGFLEVLWNLDYILVFGAFILVWPGRILDIKTKTLGFLTMPLSRSIPIWDSCLPFYMLRIYVRLYWLREIVVFNSPVRRRYIRKVSVHSVQKYFPHDCSTNSISCSKRKNNNMTKTISKRESK